MCQIRYLLSNPVLLWPLPYLALFFPWVPGWKWGQNQNWLCNKRPLLAQEWLFPTNVVELNRVLHADTFSPINRLSQSGSSSGLALKSWWIFTPTNFSQFLQKSRNSQIISIRIDHKPANAGQKYYSQECFNLLLVCQNIARRRNQSKNLDSETT